jgi:hypothetical protein
MNRGSKAIVAVGLAALSVFGPVAGGVSTASAATWRHHYVYARYYHWHHYRHYAWHRHYYYGPGPILGGLGLIAGTAAALTVGYPYYYGPYYRPYWW